jgi:membrane-bound lytic murein transglycosylase MltF
VILLLVPIAFASGARILSREDPLIPARQPIALAALAERGVLRVAVEDRTMAYFVPRGEPLGFEHDLFRRFARRHGAKLVPVVAASPGEAAALLRAERVDVALLPWVDEPRIEGGVRARPYLPDDDGGIGFPETGAPFVRADSPELLAGIESFLDEDATLSATLDLYDRYFIDNLRYRAVRVAGRWTPVPPSISRYDWLIAKHAAQAGLDWRLVSALIFEESSFDPKAVSEKGARGLMQLMPAAAADVGLARPHAPDENVRAGIAYLGRLSDIFRPSDGEDLLRIVVAAYLLGPGPVLDAQKIAREIGLDPTRWRGGVAETLPLLESEDWSERIRFPGAKGAYAVGYVGRIFKRYEQYRRELGETPELAALAPRDRPA